MNTVNTHMRNKRRFALPGLLLFLMLVFVPTNTSKFITYVKVQLTPSFFFGKTKTSNCHDTFGEKISVIDEILAILQLFKA